MAVPSSETIHTPSQDYYPFLVVFHAGDRSLSSRDDSCANAVPFPAATVAFALAHISANGKWY